MTIEIPEPIAQRLADEQIIWLTTVSATGGPVSTPVWFLWQNDRFLIFSQPGTGKLKHIAANPRVALNLNSSPAGADVVALTARAERDPNGATEAEMSAYLRKYADGIKSLGSTPEGSSRSTPSCYASHRRNFAPGERR
ncbi:TIGR03667 family PPOX class F420-dependent oxidoreductase [Branchiibius cervicis]|uniref:TIGR03667 family PPOX class F420-dependent oxidoreductase n=1 Tax=Branchiibius cervicis TaxID=908252 RepID=A0ABW2AVV5_9MICO